MNEEVKEVKPKTGRPKGAVDKVPRKKRTDVNKSLSIESGDIAKITEFNTQWLNMPTVDTGNKQEVEERIAAYFNACITNDMRPFVAGLCAALGISRTTWYYWGTGEKRDYQDLVERTRAVMESIIEQYMLQGKINPVTGIFLLKNHFGYTDKNEVVLIPKNNPLGEPLTEEAKEALAKKYLDNASAFLPDGEMVSDTDKTELSIRMKNMEKKYLTGGLDNE